MPNTDWPTIHVHSVDAAGERTPVAIGVPFPRGQVPDASTLVVRSSGGEVEPSHARTLVAWPDGSTRWALVSLLAKAKGPHTVSPGDGKAQPTNPAVTLSRDTNLTLDNGVVRIVLGAEGPGPIAKLAALGRTFIARPEDFRLCVDSADTAHESWRTVTVLEQSPVRARIRVEGAHFARGNKRKVSYRLDVELWAGQPVARFDYHFFNLEPGQEYLDVDRIAVDVTLATSPKESQAHFLQTWHDLFYQPREVLNAAQVGIVADTSRRSAHVEHPSMLLDEVDYPAYTDAPLVDTSEWLGVTDGQAHAYLHMQDMINLPPKRLASKGNQLSLEVWPPRAGTLQLQQGKSRRQVFTLSFATGQRPDATWVARTAKLPLHEGRATIDPSWLAHCGEFDQDRVLPFGKHGRFERFFGRLVNLQTPGDMFDLGDTPDTGYSTSYPSIGLDKVRRVANAPQLPRAFDASGGVLATWANPLHYERVWVNNEYDGIHAVACELMRTGNPGHWQMLRWMARHNIEVDFLHYHEQKWMHRTSPVHSARHSTSGAYPSHFWTQGLLEYYCLSGDPDVLEVAVALGDNIIFHFHDPERGRFYKNFDRENGWALLALVHLYDITREPRFQKEVDRLVDFFMHHTPADDTNTPTLEGGGISRFLIGRFYFMLNMVEAFDLYQRITGREDLSDYLRRLLAPVPERVYENYREGGGAYSIAAALAIAYERSGDVNFLRPGLVRIDELIDDDPRWLNPIPEIKPMAVMYREFVRYLGQALKAGLLDAYEYPSLRSRERRLTDSRT